MVVEPSELHALVSEDKARLVSRICGDFFLDSAVMCAEFFDGELVTGLVFLAILRENTRHIDHGSPEAIAHSGLDTPPPDDLREPVTVYAVAKVLGLTYETARRHVKRLVDRGFCLRLERGLLIPTEVLTRPEFLRANTRNLANFNRMLTDAARAGVIEVAAKSA